MFLFIGEWGRRTEEGEGGVVPVHERPVVVPVRQQMLHKLGRELERDEQLVDVPSKAPLLHVLVPVHHIHKRAQRRRLVGAIQGYVVMCPDFSNGRALCLGVVCMGRVMWDGACERTLLRRGKRKWRSSPSRSVQPPSINGLSAVMTLTSTNLMDSVVEQRQSQERADEFTRANDRDIGYESKCERPSLDQHKGIQRVFQGTRCVPHYFHLA